uniref:WRKY domain-containing protein n=1 Tax=Leersia perrieri TaxID=77586 RepID=A0A0D9WHQ8_9ORYZ
MALTTALAAGDSDVLPTRFVAEGRDSAARLYALLGQCHQLLAGSSTLHGPVGLAEQIFHCFDRALAKLHGVAGAEEDNVASASSGRKRKPEHGSVAATSKRIKASGGGNGGRVVRKATMDDNFLWRKYGQKEIKNSKHPRFYYRCSYKDDHGCKATKQVQQSEADPSIYVITYFGEHTCRHGNDAAAAVVDGGGDEDSSSPAKFVISFGNSTSSGSDNSAIRWPCAGDDAQINNESSQESSLVSEAGEEEELRPCTVSDHGELVEESTTPPVPDQPLGLTALPDLEPLLEAYPLDMELGDSSFGIDEIFNFDEHLFYSIDTAW